MSRPGLSSGVAAALGAALLFGAGTPLAKLLLASTDPWLLAGLLYAGSGLGLTLWRLLRPAAERAPLAPGDGRWLAAAVVAGGVVAPVLLGEPVTVPLLAAGALMAFGVWLHVGERHAHLHRHEPLDHEHSHEHDDHHRHDHGDAATVVGPHTHRHRHLPMAHAHAHAARRPPSASPPLNRPGRRFGHHCGLARPRDPFMPLHRRLPFAAAAASLALALAFVTAARAQTPGVLRVSAIPDEAPTELQRKFEPLGRYLKKETGLDVQFTPVTDYAAVVEGLATNKIDLAWLGGFTFVQAKLRTNGGVVPIVQRAEDAKFTSRFIVPVGSSAKTLADLKGRTFAFGAPSSTSGSLMPRYYLLKAGIDPERDFKSVAFSGAHDATVAFVAAGRAEAGVLNASVMDKLVESKNPNAEKVRVLAVTPPYYDYNWTVRPGLDAAITKKLTDAFLKLDPANPADKELMDLQRASKFIPTQASNYDGIESSGRSAGLIK